MVVPASNVMSGDLVLWDKREIPLTYSPALPQFCVRLSSPVLRPEVTARARV